MRFGEIRKAIGETTQQMLSKQLKEMERDGLVRRKVFEVAPHMSNTLSPPLENRECRLLKA